MNDLISREAAIELIKDHAYPIRYDFNSKEQGMSITGIETALNIVPSANQWIPCSERLPEKKGEYLTCSENGYIHILIWCDGWNCCLSANNKVDREYEIKNIIAWQPLPEPYVEVEK